MLASEFPEALRLAQEAFPLVEALGIAALRARTRDVTGLSRAYLGDADGIGDLAEAVAVAREGGAFYELHTAYNNLRASQLYLGRVEDASRLLDEFRRSAERSGSADIRRWVRTLEAGDLLVKGRADEALALVDEEIAQAEQGSPHYHEPAWRTLRASIRLARGDRAGAGDDSARATQVARRTKDPQSLAPSLALRARILMLDGRRDEAASLVSEVLALGRRLLSGLVDEAFAGEPLVTFAWVACDLGRNDELVAAVEVAPRTPWVDAAIAIARSDPMRAAEILERLSCRTGEAYTRLRAAQVLLRDGRHDEADAELAKALAFYRETHATAYVREAEALLTTIADRAEHGQLKRRTSTKP